MSEINSAITASDFCQLYNFVRGGENIRNILQCGADSKCALLHGLRNQLAHLLELGGRGRTVILSDYVLTHSTSADECAQIDRWARVLEVLEIFVERTPIQVDMILCGFRTTIFEQTIVQRSN